MTAKNNPFNVGFGEEPLHTISRNDALEQIVPVFQSDNPLSRTYIISGPRGSGKTVLLNEISQIFAEEKDWIVADLNPYRDMLEQLASVLFEKGKVKHLFLKEDFGFSFHGVSVSIAGENPVSDIISMLDKMFAYLMKKNKKILITIDDVSNQAGLREFIHSFQSFARAKYPAFLLISGLYENISDVENSKSLTFLLRAPKIYLAPLSLRAIAHSYEDLLNVDEAESIHLAKLTNGFAYAYQLLGSLLYNSSSKKATHEILRSYDETLEANVYQKIYEGMSEKDKAFVFAMSGNAKTKIADIVSATGMSNAMAQVYKKRLENSGIIVSNERGYVSYVLPRFTEFINFRKALETE